MSLKSAIRSDTGPSDSIASTYIALLDTLWKLLGDSSGVRATGLLTYCRLGGRLRRGQSGGRPRTGVGSERPVRREAKARFEIYIAFAISRATETWESPFGGGLASWKKGLLGISPAPVPKTMKIQRKFEEAHIRRPTAENWLLQHVLEL
jgi:hypothetical protein